MSSKVVEVTQFFLSLSTGLKSLQLNSTKGAKQNITKKCVSDLKEAYDQPTWFSIIFEETKRSKFKINILILNLSRKKERNQKLYSTNSSMA